MSKPICDSIRIDIPDYLNGMLTPAEEEAVRRHLVDCTACAAETQRLRPLMQEQLPRTRETSRVPDWGNFSVRLNAEIDRRQKKGRIPRLGPALLLLPAAALIILFLLWLLPRFTAENTQDSAPVYALTLDRLEVEDIARDGLRTLSLDDISVTTDEQASFGSIEGSDETIIIADSAVTSALHTALAENIGFEDMLSTTMEYFSTEIVLDAISENDAALLASALEIQEFAFQ